MAKELPFFKFEPGEWETGNIQMCSRESKGLFIDLCSLYWSRLGELPYALALQKLCNGKKDALQELTKQEIIGIVDGQIHIEFLDEQLIERGQTSEKRRDAANKRWKDASAMQEESKSNAKRREEKREEKKKKEEKIKEDKDPLRAIGVLPFESVEFANAWIEWETFRRELGKKLTASTAKKQMQFLGGWTEAQAIGIINQSITNGWTGLFQLKAQVNGTSKTTKAEQSNATADYLKQHYRDKINGQ